MNSELSILLFYCLMIAAVTSELNCPKKLGSDPTDVKGRLNSLVSSNKNYMYDDKQKDGYVYKWSICNEATKDVPAITQDGGKLKSPADLGRYSKSSVIGGTDWFLITYPGGAKYGSHCAGQLRKSSVMVTCDPDATKGTFKLVEEFRDNNASTSDMSDCYYLFELNNKAACTVKPVDNSLSAGSILLIVFLIVVGVYLVLGFLYQRFVAGAKGLEQIPNYEMWTTFGSLQADGCNFICRCKKKKRSPTYKPVEDALADDVNPEIDDDNDDTMLPAV